MSLQTYTYVHELEHLIRSTLLPIYDSYYREKGELPPYTAFPKGLLKEVIKPKQQCVLFSPKLKDLN